MRSAARLLHLPWTINLRIWEERDPVTEQLIAIKHYLSNYQQTRTIWMDNRPHPPEAARHTWMGFATGKFEANILTVYTTHLKSGWVKRNGLRQTDQATMTEHFIRHGDHMTHVSIVTDPATFTEPLIRTEDLVLRLQNGQNWLYPATRLSRSSARVARCRTTCREKIRFSMNLPIATGFR